MRVPLAWLREYCNPPLESAQVAERLTMTGTKVEAIHPPVADGFANYVVGRVERVEPHPNADRLRVCAVDLGGRSSQIVCGAANVAPAQLVAVALPGARLPQGGRLEAVTLRGVRSEGMILSAAELGLGGDGDGILVLDGRLLTGADGDRSQLAPGQPLSALLGGEPVLELEVTPNRPDCLAVYGVARELHAATEAPLAGEPWREDPGEPGPIPGLTVEVDCPELCPRFMVRRFTGVRVGPSPLWLQARLVAAGMRPINNVVDITNYVMLLVGEPLHAFDGELVAGSELRVRRATAGERIATLDGQLRELGEGTVVVADREGPASIAGIMGGERTEVGERTTTVLLEAATWVGPNIHASAATLGLRSEAAARFEKGLPPEAAAWGLALASSLLCKLTGAVLDGGTADLWAGQGQPPVVVRLRTERVERLLGVAVAVDRQRQLLEALGFGVERSTPGELAVAVPPWRRGDVSREADLIEEIARLDALERLPARLPARRQGPGLLAPSQRLRRRLADLLGARGFFEVVGWTFSSPRELAELGLDRPGPLGAAVRLRNPLSAEQSLLRPTLLTSLRAAAAANIARGRTDLQLFELGHTFAWREGEIVERDRLGVLACGPIAGRGWRSQPGQAAEWDFFALKGLAEALCLAAGGRLRARACRELPFLHPGRCGWLFLDGDRPLGFLGELHPQATPEGVGRAVYCELELAQLAAAAQRQRAFQALPQHPPLSRDLAFALPREVAAEQVEAALRCGCGELLEEVRLIDLYEGPTVGAGRRSLAFALTFRAPDRTLNEREVEPLIERAVAAVAELGGELRGGGDG